MTPPPAPPPRTDWRPLIGYLLCGLGGAMLGFSYIALRFFFFPKRGHPVLPFSPHHPIAIIGAVAILVGGPMFLVGVVLIKASKGGLRIFDDGPPD